jgi:hypothetical protein
MQGITDDMYCTSPCTIFQKKSAKLITPWGADSAIVIMLLRYLRCLSSGMDTWHPVVCLGGLRMVSIGHHLLPASFPRCCPCRPWGSGRSRGCHVGLPLQPIVALVLSELGWGGGRQFHCRSHQRNHGHDRHVSGGLPLCISNPNNGFFH